ncbi:MAG: gamma carbonic anhydrase family protein [Acetobacteraceae bacterium]|nr:gamma carbonic anhydrase family protein [Acetobacteraceae bacterium]
MLREHGGERPRLGSRVFVAPGAEVIGRVELGDGCNVWFGAVLRGDLEWIRVGPGTSIQDGCVLHADRGLPLEVGKNCVVGHGAVLHSCRVEDGCLVGMGAVVLDRARVGRGSVLGAGAVVPEGAEIPPESVAVGVPARVVRPATPADAAAVSLRVEIYRRLAASYGPGEGC